MRGWIPTWIVAVGLSISSIASGESIFINEFHYDDIGTDSNQFVEVAVPTGADLTGLLVAIYRGNGTISATGDVELFTPGSTAGDFMFYTTNFVLGDGPDGLALVRNGTVLEFISYEGTLTATNGPAIGMTSTSIGAAAETGSANGTSVGRTGTGNSASDFAWVLFANDTPGQINTDQTFTSLDVAVAPLPIAAMAGIALFGGFGLMRRRSSHLS